MRSRLNQERDIDIFEIYLVFNVLGFNYYFSNLWL